MTNQPIKTALLSFGMSGRVFHAPFIQIHPGFELIGAWERSTKTIQNFYPETQSFNQLEEILDNSSIELVVVNTPIYTHFELSKKTLESGKNIIVEKAFTSNFQEAESLAEIAKSKNLKVSVFQNRRWDSDFLTVKKIVNSGALGEIKEAEFHFDRFNPNLSPKIHKETVNAGSGIVKDLGPHIIDQAISLFGMPKAIFADLQKTRENTLVEDYFEIILFYPKLRVRLKGGYFYKEMVPSYQVFGTKGSFLKSRSDRQEMDLVNNLKPNSEDWGVENEDDFGILNDENGRRIIPSERGNYLHYYNDIYKGLRENKAFEVGIEAGLNTMKIIDLAFLSAKEKCIIEL